MAHAEANYFVGTVGNTLSKLNGQEVLIHCDQAEEGVNRIGDNKKVLVVRVPVSLMNNDGKPRGESQKMRMDRIKMSKEARSTIYNFLDNR